MISRLIVLAGYFSPGRYTNLGNFSRGWVTSRVLTSAYRRRQTRFDVDEILRSGTVGLASSQRPGFLFPGLGDKFFIHSDPNDQWPPYA